MKPEDAIQSETRPCPKRCAWITATDSPVPEYCREQFPCETCLARKVVKARTQGGRMAWIVRTMRAELDDLRRKHGTHKHRKEV